jgi:hypothetical protein
MISLTDIARAVNGKIYNNSVRAPGKGHSAEDNSLWITLENNAWGFRVHSHSPADHPREAFAYVLERIKATVPGYQVKQNGIPRFNGGDTAKLIQEVAAAQKEQRRRVIAKFDYTDEAGALLYQCLKYEPKGFSQRRPDGAGGWVNNLSDVRRVPYHLPDLIAHPDASVICCEGEKDSDSVAALDLVATTVVSGKWTNDCINALAGRHCYIVRDMDEAGAIKATQAAQLLHPVAASVKIVALPGLDGTKNNKDLTDWLDAGHTKDQLIDVCANTPDWIPDVALPAPAGDVCTVDTRTALIVAPSIVPAVIEKAPAPRIQTSRQFVAAYTPPDYLVHGLLQEAFLYALTGATGAGKTSITLQLAASVALGRSFAGRETKQRRVLYLAAENPTDIRMRWIALAQQTDFDPETVDVFFVEGTFRISKMTAVLQAEAERVGDEFGLVIIDTGPVFYEGDDENNRSQQSKHAEMLRGLIGVISGKPAVIANCHPVKNAAPDNLLPAGGGSFLNQIDGNLTAAKTDSTTELHWQGKFRGVEFAPMHFMLRTVTHETLKDSKGGLIPTVVCDFISDTAKEDIARQRVSDEDQLLAAIAGDPSASLSGLAIRMGWKLHSGDPHKVKASRYIKTLKGAKLIRETRAGKYQLTDEGRKILNKDDGND